MSMQRTSLLLAAALIALLPAGPALGVDDVTDIEIDVSFDPPEPDGEDGWYRSPIGVSFASDDSEAEIEWRFAETSVPRVWNEPYALDIDGEYELEYWGIWTRPWDEATDGVPDPLPFDQTIEVRNNEFDAELSGDRATIHTGGSVTFERVEGEHNVVIWDNPNYDRSSTDGIAGVTGSSWSTYEFVPPEQGEYYFNCTLQPGMSGSLHVWDFLRIGDRTEPETAAVKLDQTDPVTSAVLDGPEGAGTEDVENVFTDEVTVELDAFDATSGVASTQWRVNGEAAEYEGLVTLSTPGEHTLEFRSVDVAGNAEPWRQVAVTIDPDAEPLPPEGPQGSVCARNVGSGFPDVDGSGHDQFIECLSALGVVQGYADGTFGHADDVSRAQLASFVVRALETAGHTLPVGKATFDDVSASSEHGSAIYALVEAGVLSGYGDGTFGPWDPVTREQTATFVAGALELAVDELPTGGRSFPDVTGGTHAPAIDQLVTADVVGGYPDGTFGPRQPVTRAQMTRFIGNGLDVLQDHGQYDGP